MFGDIGKMMKIARDVKTRMPAMREELDGKEFTVTVGGGVVTAVVNGKMQLVKVAIDPEVAADDVAMLEDLIVAAVSAAQSQAARAAAEMMQELTGGMDLPGLDGLLG